MKKITSILFVLLLTVSMLSTTALASDITEHINFTQIEETALTSDTTEHIKFIQIAETADGLTVSAPMQYWTYTRSITNGMVISGNSATMCTKVETYGGYQSSKISVTSTVQRMSNGKWVYVTSRSGNGTGYCLYENDITLSANQTYRIVTTGTTTYNNQSENISATSKIYYT